jgi:hypothetical protein
VRPVESRGDLVWLDPPRLLSPHRGIMVMAFDRSKPLPAWLVDELAEPS